MIDSIKKKYSLNICGVLSYDDGMRDFVISIEDRGDFRLSELLECFDGKQCKILVTYDEDYGIDDDENEVI